MSQTEFANLGLPFMTYEDFSTSPSEDSIEGQEDYSDNDDLSLEVGDKPAIKRRSRRPPPTAAKRATHNAIERARRESLNGRFLELAKALPNMATVKRPSKSSIVIKSLEYVYQVQSRERALVDEKAALQKEVDDLRARLTTSAAAPEYVLSSTPVSRDRSDSGSDVSSLAPVSSGTEYLSMFQPLDPFFAAAPPAFPSYHHPNPAVMGFDWSGMVTPVVQPNFGIFAQ